MTNNGTVEGLVMSVEAPMLTDAERTVLLTAINVTRAGLMVCEVAFLYDKQTKAKPRIGGTDYLPLPGDAGKLHVGTLCAAPTNKAGEVYLRVLDSARGTGEVGAQWTCVKLKGLKGFQVRAVKAKAPAAPEEHAAPF